MTALAGLIILGGLTLAADQSASQKQRLASFDDGAATGSGLTSALFAAGALTSANLYGSELDSSRSEAKLASLLHGTAASYGVVISDQSVELSVRTPPGAVSRIAERPAHVARVLDGESFGLSGVLGRNGDNPRVEYVRGFNTPEGRRALVTDIDLDVLRTLIGGYLVDIPQSSGGHGLVVDADGLVLAGPPADRTGEIVPDPVLAKAIAEAGTETPESFGYEGGNHISSVPIEGTPWRVIQTVPLSMLMPPRPWVPWLILLGLAVMGLGALTLVSRAIKRSEQLRSTNHQLEDSYAELQESRLRYQLAVEGSRDGIWDGDLSRGQLHLAPRWCEMLGLDPNEEISPEQWMELVHPDDRERVRASLSEYKDENRNSAVSVEYRLRRADGELIWVLSRGASVLGEDGSVARVAGSLSDITERKRAEQLLEKAALHDYLTGLPNRALFMDRLIGAAARDRRYGSSYFVIFLDLDGFKQINDQAGHACGDEILKTIATRLDHETRAHDTVSRFGGDEFTILIDPVKSLTEPYEIARRMHRAVNQPIVVDGKEFQISCSIGGAQGVAGTDPELILARADEAMYRAKKRLEGGTYFADEAANQLELHS